MVDQVLRLLSTKITDIDFRRDLKHQLRAIPSLEHAKLGWLDEAIARGFGFRSHAALLNGANREVTEISNQGFRDRLLEFGVTAEGNLFRETVLKLIEGSPDVNDAAPLPVIISEEQKRLLESVSGERGNLLVCGSDPDANCSMLVELIRDPELSFSGPPSYALTPDHGPHAVWIADTGVLTMKLPEDAKLQKDMFLHTLRHPGIDCVINGITQATLEQTRFHMTSGIRCTVSMAIENRYQTIDDAIDLFMIGDRVGQVRRYLHSVLHVEPVDGAVRIMEMRRIQYSTSLA